MRYYLNFLNNAIAAIDKIDKETLWQEKEPEWWLQMMETKVFLIKQKEQLTP